MNVFLFMFFTFVVNYHQYVPAYENIKKVDILFLTNELVIIFEWIMNELMTNLVIVLTVKVCLVL